MTSGVSIIACWHFLGLAHALLFFLSYVASQWEGWRLVQFLGSLGPFPWNDRFSFFHCRQQLCVSCIYRYRVGLRSEWPIDYWLAAGWPGSWETRTFGWTKGSSPSVKYWKMPPSRESVQSTSQLLSSTFVSDVTQPEPTFFQPDLLFLCHLWFPFFRFGEFVVDPSWPWIHFCPKFVSVRESNLFVSCWHSGYFQKSNSLKFVVNLVRKKCLRISSELTLMIWWQSFWVVLLIFWDVGQKCFMFCTDGNHAF